MQSFILVIVSVNYIFIEFFPLISIFDLILSEGEMIAMMKRMKEEEARRLEEETAKDITERIKREMEEAAGEVYVFTKSKKCPSCGFHIQVISHKAVVNLLLN